MEALCFDQSAVSMRQIPGFDGSLLTCQPMHLNDLLEFVGPFVPDVLVVIHTVSIA
jgi:hypothetical protein